MDPKPLVLVVDDESTLRRALSRALTSRFDVRVAESADEAEAFFAAGVRFDLVISDYAMPGRNGLELARALRLRDFLGRILLVTGIDVDPIADACRDGVVDDVMIKPWSLDDLFGRVDALCAPAVGEGATLPGRE